MMADGSEPRSREYPIKAAFIFNFTKFVEWAPDRSEPEPGSPIVVGLMGRDPFEGELAKLLHGREVRGQGFEVKTVTTMEDAAAVHLLFVPIGEDHQLSAEAIEALHRAGVLTVGECPRFARKGGTITFVMQSNKVRFRINRDSIAQSGLRFSAQLLQLAVPDRGKS